MDIDWQGPGVEIPSFIAKVLLVPHIDVIDKSLVAGPFEMLTAKHY